MKNIEMKKLHHADSLPVAIERLKSIGFGYYDDDGNSYWCDDRYYQVTNEFGDRLYHITKELWYMCLDAVGYVIDNDLYDKFHIPKFIQEHIKKTWDNDAPSIYGRFDFGYDSKTDSIKLLEFNADTPTSLFETGVVQWYWKEHYFKNYIDIDQFSSVHERMIEYWTILKDYLKGEVLHFTCVRDSLEDLTNVEYIRDTAIQAGINTKLLYIDEIGWNGENFTDLEEEPITDIFKLYPYEWMVNEEFGKLIPEDRLEANWIEPSWKMILSNKAILPILWQLFPNHPNLLECYFDDSNGMKNYVKKPLLSREGANITIVKDGEVVAQTDGEYGEEGFIYQEFVDLHKEDTGYIIIGSWVIGQESVGISFRESENLVTDNMSRYIPHILKD